MFRKYITLLKYQTLIQLHPSEAKKIRRKIDHTEFESHLLHNVLPNLHKWKDSPEQPINPFELTPIVELPLGKDDCIGIIVETRIHEHLINTLQNYFSAVNRPALLFCSTHNLPLIMDSDLKDKVGTELFPIIIEHEPFGVRNYNELFLSEAFWNIQPIVKQILVFQTDGYFNPNSKYQLTDFAKYDYIGADWVCRIRTNGLVIDGGIGGVSLRNQSLSRAAVRRFASLGWEGGEDDFFGFYIELLGGKVARKLQCNQFCQQNEFKQYAFSVHQPSNMNRKDQLKFNRAFPDCYLTQSEH